jgi:hypothetical protein
MSNSYLEPQDKALFFKLYFDLLYCVNEKHKIVNRVADGRYPKSVDTPYALRVRDELFDNPAWIDEYLSEYGDERTQAERSILTSWRDHFIKSDFFVMRNQKKYTVFMCSGDESTTRLYGVVGLNHPISDLFNISDLPSYIKALILPFEGMIIYDGMMISQNIRLGPNIRRELSNFYKISKEKFGIIESLPFIGSPVSDIIEPPTPKPPVKQSKVSKEKVEEIASIITDFCNTHLNEEYTEVSLRLLEKLRRKRPSPLLKGRTNTWACGIVYSIGSTNFLFDKTQTPHMRASELASHFGISQSTAGSKSGEICKIFNITRFDPKWTLPSMLADNPFVWMFETKNGFVFDARNASRETQEQLLEAGMIPFIPPPRENTIENMLLKESKPKKRKENGVDGQLSFEDE